MVRAVLRGRWRGLSLRVGLRLRDRVEASGIGLRVRGGTRGHCARLRVGLRLRVRV